MDSSIELNLNVPHIWFQDRIQSWLEAVTTGRISSFWEKETKRQEREQERKEYISQLQKQGETHLIVSALITTVTFAAGFTLPGGYKEDDGQAILSKKAAFRAFVVTDTIAMVSSLCVVFLHFFMTLHKRGKFLEKHLLWAFIFTRVGMGAMAIAFATGLYAVLPHSSGLSVLTCILCSCFFLSIAVEYCKFWRGTISEWMFGWAIFWEERENRVWANWYPKQGKLKVGNQNVLIWMGIIF